MEVDESTARLIVFLDAQITAEEKGEHEFICPLCGGRAWWKCSVVNGHLSTGCDVCGIFIIE